MFKNGAETFLQAKIIYFHCETESHNTMSNLKINIKSEWASQQPCIRPFASQKIFF